MKVFIDTNIIFKWLLWKIKWNKLEKFISINYPNYKFFISDYVIIELFTERALKKLKTNKKHLKQILLTFLKETNIKMINSKPLNQKFLNYVNDIKDWQILQDAVNSRCNIILTYNIKDFKTDLISKNFNIQILTPSQFVKYVNN